MELVGIDDTKVIYLHQVNRPIGQPYWPETIGKTIARYSFAKYPKLEDLGNDFQAFGIGKFKDVQIQEIKIYNDGIIVSSRANSKILDDFIDDLFSWAEKEFGLVPIVTSKPEKYYESSLVVKSKTDLTKVMGLNAEVCNNLNKRLESKYVATPFYPSGLVLNCDPHEQGGGKRKPFRFLLERRIGFPFSDNVFFSQAPLMTDDHLDFLANLERLAG